MTKTIFDKLALKQKFQKRLLRDYVETLDRVFQIIYEIEANVDWMSIDRCSPVSNFGIVRGSVVVPKGIKIKNIQGDYAEFDEDRIFDAGFMIPLATLDECTPYEIAEYVHQMKMLQVVATQEEFVELLHSSEFFADDIQEYLPSDIPRTALDEIVDDEDMDDLTQQEEMEILMRNKALPENISGFDFNELSSEQIESLMMGMLGGSKHESKQ